MVEPMCLPCQLWHRSKFSICQNVVADQVDFQNAEHFLLCGIQHITVFLLVHFVFALIFGKAYLEDSGRILCYSDHSHPTLPCPSIKSLMVSIQLYFPEVSCSHVTVNLCSSCISVTKIQQTFTLQKKPGRSTRINVMLK